MKNLVLVAVLFALVGVGWLLEGKRGFDGEPGYEGAQPVVELAPGGVLEIHLPKVKIANGQQGLRVLGLEYPASPDKFESLVKRLNSLRAIKKLDIPDDKIEQFFTHQDHFILVKSFEGELRMRMGDVSEITGDFYLQTFKNGRQNLYLVKDTSLFEGFYQNELELNLRKYLALKELVASSPFDFVDNRIFGNPLPGSLNAIKVDNKINRWFELNFAEGSTSPAPPNGVKTLLDRSSISKMLNELRFSRFYPLEGNSLSNLLSVIELNYDEGSKKAELFGEMNGQKGMFAKVEGKPNLIFAMEDEGKNLFFENAQRFWLKRPELGVDPASLEELTFSIGSRKNELTGFKVADLEKFEISPVRDDVSILDLEYFNLVFNALFAVNGFEQAAFVNQLSQTEARAKEEAFKEKVYVSIFDKLFLFAIENSEMVVLDLENGVELRYPVVEIVERLTEKQFFAFI